MAKINKDPLSGKVILITGASSGIGAATARALAGCGCKLVLAARRLGRLEDLAREISMLAGDEPRVLPVQLDVSDKGQIESVVQRALERFGKIDVLFNNAGVSKLDWLDKMSLDQDIERQIEINLLGTIRMTRAVIPHMQVCRSGHVINMISLSGLIATPTYTIYAASKFGLRGFNQALRREVAPWGIQVSAIYPGGVDTDFAAESVKLRKTGLTTPGFMLISPENLARVVVKLIRRPKREVILPRVLRPVVWINRFFPGLIDWVVVRQFVRPERADELALNRPQDGEDRG